MNAAARAITTTVNGWSSIRKCGQPGNGILVRAACAKALPVVNVVEEAAYWTTTSLSFLAKHLVGVSCVAVLGVPGREVYYLYMASIVGKRQRNATYYYLVESARVDGKPRIVSQQYLGSAAEVMAKLAGGGPGEPVRVQYRSFGDLAAVWSVLTQIGVAAIIDGVA